jgi:hypothetical protein
MYYLKAVNWDSRLFLKKIFKCNYDADDLKQNTLEHQVHEMNCLVHISLSYELNLHVVYEFERSVMTAIQSNRLRPVFIHVTKNNNVFFVKQITPSIFKYRHDL